MPLYSVRLREPDPSNHHWWMQVHQIRARSPAAAVLHLERVYPGTIAVGVRQLKEVDRDYWRKIWRKAYDKMPTMVRVIARHDWIPQEPGTTHLPKFIKAEAHGTMRVRNGIVEKLRVKRTTYHRTKEACLAELLGYCKADRRSHHLRAIPIIRGLAFGVVPRATKNTPGKLQMDRRATLLMLAGPQGAAYVKGFYKDKFNL